MTLNVSGRFATDFAWKNTLLSKNDRITLFKIRLYYTAGIFVNKNNQSRGIGKQLLDYVKEIKETLNLSVYQKNIRAISFYQREQFVIQSEHIYNDNSEKEFIMTWSK